ncbi:Fe-S cluster assembly protein SufD [Paenibacillus selenitireducens]|uniref:Fe-S cluster assembly protein SufD n=1 Tax=Paenibacillus selenitireducens TaxID=1324314 RepID=A0A1T2XMC7_9BACL|nr:Fe-S cluster assembly protein SufD [Paenibacillus selenitireducens]OPA80823.1 Fe-S cluster assembly protein SufD [Paenibacillus selenitireducens]
MTTQTILPIDRETLAALSQSNNEPAWLSTLRLEALELAGQLELPVVEKQKISRWNLDAYGSYKSSPAIQSLSELPESLQSLVNLEESSNILVQRNSSAVFQKLSAELAAKGVIFTDLNTAIQQHGELVQKYLFTAVKKDENRLAALHAALWNGGVFVYVPKNVDVELPLQAIMLSDDATATFAPHVLIIAESNSRLTYVDNYLSTDGVGLDQAVHNGVVEVFVKPGANVRFASVQHLNATNVTYRRAVVENDGRIEWIIGEMHNGNAVSETMSVLQGNGSSSDMKVICAGTNEQKLSITTKAVHFGKSSDSQMFTRAVMRDAASAIINGITKIEKGSTKANGEQTEKVLMLSPKARGDANPILLIDEDDVTAGHAASVGQVNPEQVYYLMSRGIPKSVAERLIIHGFLAPVISEIPLENVQEQLRSLMERKLGQ